MNIKERVAEAFIEIESIYIRPTLDEYATAAIKAMHEPDLHAVAKAADQLNMDATKVAAVWMIMIEEMGK